MAEICAFEQLQMSGMNGEAHRRVRMAAQKGFGSPRALDMADYVKRLVGDDHARRVHELSRNLRQGNRA